MYQRALETPIHNLENLWKDYEAFENEVNKLTVKGLTGEMTPKYLAARNSYRERKRNSEGILRNMLAIPPRSGEKEKHQVSLWKRLIVYEKSNPQR